MDVRCQNCGEHLVTPPLKPTETTAEVICHSCGVTMRVRVPFAAAKGTHPAAGFGPAEDEPRPSERTWKRVFEPVPRTFIYLSGLAVAVVLLSPFWVLWFQERYARNPIILSDDNANNPMPPATNQTATPIISVPEIPPTTLDQYHNVRLEAGRDDVQHRFNLNLQNTRGMEPEIYEATKGIEFERFSAPIEQSEIAGPLPSSSSIGFTANELARKLDSFAFHRSLTWTDAQYRVEATIHYSSPDPAQCRSMLALHMSATAWLKKRQPLTSAVPPPR